MLEKYDSSSSGMVYEIIGDILSKQDKPDLAKAQYFLAKDLYTDEVSIDIVSMKIANL
jgi:predicted negative regulator of RcsB-dependent stress response